MTDHLFSLLLCVDKMFIAVISMKEINKLNLKLNREFEIKDLSSTRKILGMDRLTLSQ